MTAPGAPSPWKSELMKVFTFIGIVWVVFLVSRILPVNEWLGLQPRYAMGLIGIVSMPFLHADLTHLVSNTIPLLVLLLLLASSQRRVWEIVVGLIFLSGLLLWIFGRNGTDEVRITHIGASALVLGLVVFLILAGIFERRLLSILIALITGFFYGGSILGGVIGVPQGVSWDGHLCGIGAGFLLAYGLGRRPAIRDQLAQSRWSLRRSP